MGQNDSNRLIGLNVRVGPGSGNRAHPAHSPQIIQINRSRASALSGSMRTFMFFDWLGYTHRYSVSVPQPVKKHGSFCGSRKPWRPYVGREGRFRKNTALCVFGRARFSCGILRSPEIWLDVHRHHMFFVFCPPRWFSFSDACDIEFLVVQCKRSILFLLCFLLKPRTNGRKCKIWTHECNVTVQYLLSFARKPDANTDHIVAFCPALAGTLSAVRTMVDEQEEEW